MAIPLLQHHVPILLHYPLDPAEFPSIELSWIGDDDRVQPDLGPAVIPFHVNMRGLDPWMGTPAVDLVLDDGSRLNVVDHGNFERCARMRTG